jgi:hypothetical protein
MKWKLPLVLLAGIAVGAYVWLPGRDTPQKDEAEPVSAAIPNISSPPAEAGFPTPPAAGDGAAVVIDPDQQAMADKLEAEIKTLMADFDRYRNDAERRDQIQSEIDVLLAEYNELILPIALTKIKEGN